MKRTYATRGVDSSEAPVREPASRGAGGTYGRTLSIPQARREYSVVALGLVVRAAFGDSGGHLR